MVMLPLLDRIVLTVVFGVTALGYLVRSILANPLFGRTSDILHVLMSLAMIAMPWSWGMNVAPPEAQVAFFGLATAFYVGLLAWRPAAVAATDHHGGRGTLLFHAIMMLSMVIMALTRQPPIHMVFSVFFAAAALWYAAALVRPRNSGVAGRVNSTLLLLMSAGMSLAFLPLS